MEYEEKTLEELFGPPAGAMAEDVMTQAALEAMVEYSCSIPTGTTIGKKWKCDRNFGRRSSTVGPDWMTGEYIDHQDPNKVGIKWRKVVIVASGKKA